MIKSKYFPSALAAAFISLICCNSALADNLARYSLDGGASWTEQSDLKAALVTVVNGNLGPAIIETKADGSMKTAGHTQTKDVTIRPWSGDNTTYKLTCVSSPWIIKDGATLTLSNINVVAKTYNAGMIQVSSGCTLVLGGGSSLTTELTSGSGQAVVTSGTLIFDGGVISGWNSSMYGVVKYSSDSGRVYIYNGGVENCSNASTGDTSASAICGEDREFKSETEPVFVMTGGFVRNNHCSNASGRAGAIGFRSGAVATISITGGVITNNTGVSADFSAIRLGNSGTLNVAGNPIIADNISDCENTKTVKNVDLTLGTPSIVQSGNLTSGANVGVYSAKYAKDESFGTLSDTSYTGAEYFLNDRNSTLVGSASGTDLVWAEKALETVSLTIPAKTGLNSPTVTSTIGTPTETSSGVWAVAQNSTVTLTYTAETGYRITSGNPVEVSMGTSDRTMTTEELPAVLQQVVLTIPARSDVEVDSVSGGNATAITAGSTYYVDPNSEITINFTASNGYEITTGNPVVYNIGDANATLDTFPTTKKAVVKPSIGETSASVSSGTATISITNVVRGTDAQGEQTASYAVWYKLGENADVRAIAAETQTYTSFDITQLEDGDYSCKVWIANSADVLSETNTVNFTVGQKTGWTVSPVGDETTFVTDGTLVNAYSIQGGDINGVNFAQTRPITSALSPNPAPVNNRYGDFGWGGWTESGNFQQVLSHASYWNTGSTVSLTFSGLTVGHKYLAQFVSHNDSAKGITISIEGTTPQHICSTATDSTYQRGASIVGIFQATEATKTITVTFTGLSDSTEKAGEGVLNAIQLRDLGVPIVYVAQVGDTKYSTIAEALAAATAGQTVTILKDVTVDSIADIKYDITIDANGNVVTLDDAVMSLTNNLTLTCSGTMTEKGFKNLAQITVAAGKTLDASALSWAAGLIDAGQAEPTASFTLNAGASYKQGLGAIWDDALTNIFTVASRCKLTLSKSDTIASIAAEACGTVDLGGGFTAYDYGDGTWHIAGSGELDDAAALKNQCAKTIIVENGVTAIGDAVFQKWYGIESVTLGADVTSVGSNAFHKCYALNSVTSTSTSSVNVGVGAFMRCNSLETLSFETNPTWAEQSFKIQAAIKIVSGEPVVYAIPEITIGGKAPVVEGKKLLSDSAWTDLTGMTPEQKREYHFFRITTAE